MSNECVRKVKKRKLLMDYCSDDLESDSEMEQIPLPSENIMDYFVTESVTSPEPDTNPFETPKNVAATSSEQKLTPIVSPKLHTESTAPLYELITPDASPQNEQPTSKKLDVEVATISSLAELVDVDAGNMSPPVLLNDVPMISTNIRCNENNTSSRLDKVSPKKTLNTSTFSHTIAPQNVDNSIEKNVVSNCENEVIADSDSHDTEPKMFPTSTRTTEINLPGIIQQEASSDTVNKAVLPTLHISDISPVNDTKESTLSTADSDPVISNHSINNMTSTSVTVSEALVSKDTVNKMTGASSSIAESNPLVNVSENSNNTVQNTDGAALSTAGNATVVVESAEEDYEVEQVLAKRKINGYIEYFIQWKGYDESENMWLPKKDLNCTTLIKSFEKKEYISRKAFEKAQRRAAKRSEKRSDSDSSSWKSRRESDDETPVKKAKLSISLSNVHSSSPPKKSLDKSKDDLSQSEVEQCPVEKVVGVNKFGRDIYYLVKERVSKEDKYLHSMAASSKCPHLVLEFLESMVQWD